VRRSRRCGSSEKENRKQSEETDWEVVVQGGSNDAMLVTMSPKMAIAWEAERRGEREKERESEKKRRSGRQSGEQVRGCVVPGDEEGKG